MTIITRSPDFCSQLRYFNVLVKSGETVGQINGLNYCSYNLSLNSLIINKSIDQSSNSEQRDKPLLGRLDQLDFPAVNFLSRQFFKGVFQVTVRGKLNHPVQNKMYKKRENDESLQKEMRSLQWCAVQN